MFVYRRLHQIKPFWFDFSFILVLVCECIIILWQSLLTIFSFVTLLLWTKKKQRNDKPGKQHNLQNKNNIQTITNKKYEDHTKTKNEQGDGEKKIYNKTTYTVSIHSRPNG